MLAQARSGSRRALGRLFSDAEEAARDGDGPAAGALHAMLVSTGDPQPSRVVGLTGPPGAGKSSLAATLAAALLAQGRRVAVLAVDPSSPVTGGALLGDRVRFADQVAAGEGFLVVRSIASRGQVGGLAAALPLSVAVAVAAGFDDVLVETVGSGQGEIAVTSAVDTTVLVAAPGLGDDIQAAKAGIAELADIICVTKADLPGAAEAARQWRSEVSAAGAGAWQPLVVTASARTGDVSDLLAALDSRAEWLAEDPQRRGRGAAGHPPAQRPSGQAVADAERAWRAAASAAGRGQLTATLALLGHALVAQARVRVPGTPDADAIAAAGLDRVLGTADLDPERLATSDGLAALVATVKGRVDVNRS